MSIPKAISSLDEQVKLVSLTVDNYRDHRYPNMLHRHEKCLFAKRTSKKIKVFLCGFDRRYRGRVSETQILKGGLLLADLVGQRRLLMEMERIAFGNYSWAVLHGNKLLLLRFFGCHFAEGFWLEDVFFQNSLLVLLDLILLLLSVLQEG